MAKEREEKALEEAEAAAAAAADDVGEGEEEVLED